MQRTELQAMFYGAKRTIFQNAEVLRNDMTKAEKMLWSRLKKSQLGIRFKPQHPIDIFVADFYCHKYKIASLALICNQCQYSIRFFQVMQLSQVTDLRQRAFSSA